MKGNEQRKNFLVEIGWFRSCVSCISCWEKWYFLSTFFV